MDEPILSLVKRRLEAAKGSWPQISTETGVPYSTIANVVQEKVGNPRIGTIQKLLDWFKAQDAAQEHVAG